MLTKNHAVLLDHRNLARVFSMHANLFIKMHQTVNILCAPVQVRALMTYCISRLFVSSLLLAARWFEALSPYTAPSSMSS